jgi:DNA-binding NarL/FixJ family response regulator
VAESRIRLVVADDDDAFVEALCAFLKTQGDVEVVARAHNGAEAVEAVRRARPDVVLLDLEMPVLDGIGAAKLIHSEQHACVVLVSGSDERDSILAAREAGANAFVPKAHVFTELMPTLRRLDPWRKRSPSADSSSATARSRR